MPATAVAPTAAAMLGMRSPLQGLFKGQGAGQGGGEEGEGMENRPARGPDEYGYHNENDGEREVGGDSVQPGKPSVQRGLFTQSTQGQGHGLGGQGGVLAERPNEAVSFPAHRTAKAPTRGAAFDPLKVSRRRPQQNQGGSGMVLDYQDPSVPLYYASGRRGGGGSPPVPSGSPPSSSLAILEAQGLMGPSPTRGVPLDSSDTHSLAPTSSISSEGPFRRNKRAPSIGRKAGAGGVPRGSHTLWGGSKGLGGAGAGAGSEAQGFADTSSVSSGAVAVGPTQSITSSSSRMSETHRWLSDAGKALGWSSSSQSQSPAQSQLQSPHESGTPSAYRSLPRGDAEGIPEEEEPTTPPARRTHASLGGSFSAVRPRTAPPKKQWGAEGLGGMAPGSGAGNAGAGVPGSPVTETPQRHAWRAKWAKRGSPLSSSAPQFPRGRGVSALPWGQSEAESEAETERSSHRSTYARGQWAQREGVGYKGPHALSHSPSSRAQRVERLLRARGSRGYGENAPRLWKPRSLADAPPNGPILTNGTGTNASATSTGQAPLGRAWAQQGDPGVYQHAAGVQYLGPLAGTPEGGGAGVGLGLGLAGAGHPGLGLSAAYQRRDTGYAGSGHEEGSLRRRGGQRLMATPRLSPGVVLQMGGGPQREAQMRSLIQARQLAVLQQARERAAAAQREREQQTNGTSAPGTPPPEEQGEVQPLRRNPIPESRVPPLLRASLGSPVANASPRKPALKASSVEGDRGEPTGYSSETSSYSRDSRAGHRLPTRVAPELVSGGGGDSMMRFGSVASSSRRGLGMVASVSQSSNASGPHSVAPSLGSAGGVVGAPAVGALPPGYRLFETPSLEGLREDPRSEAKGSGNGSRFRLRRVLSLGQSSTFEADEADDRLLRHRQSTMLRQQLLLQGLQQGREEALLPRSFSVFLPNKGDWGQGQGEGERERERSREEGDGDGEERERAGELLGYRDWRKALGARPATAAPRGRLS